MKFLIKLFLILILPLPIKADTSQTIASVVMLIYRASLKYVSYGGNIMFILIEGAAHCADVKPIYKVAGRQSQKVCRVINAGRHV